MLAKELLELRTRLDVSSILLAYSGYMTEQVRIAVGETLKQKMCLDDTSTKTMRSVFGVFVEQMQNIIRYSAETFPETPSGDGAHDELRYGILTIGRKDGHYIMLSGNLILNEDVKRVSERLEQIRSMDHEHLRKYYKEMLKQGPDEHSKGAGIGFIEIARRASQPIEFDFTQFDEKHHFFALKAVI